MATDFLLDVLKAGVHGIQGAIQGHGPQGNQVPKAPAQAAPTATGVGPVNSPDDLMSQFGSFVDRLEAGVAQLSGHMAPGDVHAQFTSVVPPLAGQLGQLAMQAKDHWDDSIVAGVQAHRVRMSAALDTLSVLGRTHKVPLRESQLEDLFDAEAEFDSNTNHPMKSRADMYYYEKFHQDDSGKTPTSDAVFEHILHDETMSPAGDRDALVDNILVSAGILKDAVTRAYVDVAGVINEPDAPEASSMLEDLAGVLIKSMLAVIAGPLGKLVETELKSIGTVASGAGKAAGKAASKAAAGGANGHLFGDSFSKAMGDLAKQPVVNAAVLGPKALHGIDNTAHPKDHGATQYNKKAFLGRLETESSTMGQNIAQNVASKRGELLRTPVADLRGLHAGFTPALAEHAKGLMKTHMITEWVNYTKVAAEHGHNVVTGKPLRPQVLDGLSPSGVLTIDMVVPPTGRTLSVSGVTLAGISAPVLEELAAQPGGLASLRVHKMIRVSHNGLVGGFDVDPDSKITPQSSNSDDAKIMFANLGPTKTHNLDVDSMTGMAAVFGVLEKIPRSKIR